MNRSYSYTRELELLILDTLLPVYIESRKAKGFENPYEGINPDLLKQLKTTKTVAALFKPPEMMTRHC